MKPLITALFILCGAGAAMANVSSTDYVDDAVSTRVSTEQSAKQTLQGQYTVSGVFEVETPKLPSEI